MKTRYNRLSIGHVLHYMRELGVADRYVSGCSFGDNTVPSATGVVNIQGRRLARYRYFDGIEYPVFYFEDPQLSPIYHPLWVVHGGGNTPETLKPLFRLSLSESQELCLTLHGPSVTEKLRDFLAKLVWNGDRSLPEFKIAQDAKAVITGLRDTPGDRWIQITLFQSTGAQAFIDYINNTFSRKAEPGDVAPFLF